MGLGQTAPSFASVDVLRDLPTKSHRVSSNVLASEHRIEFVKPRACQVDVLTFASSKTREIPSRRIRMTNDDETHPFARSEIQWLGGSEQAVFVKRFNGMHIATLALRVRPESDLSEKTELLGNLALGLSSQEGPFQSGWEFAPWVRSSS
jgi:hypothetical protein